MNYDCGHYSNSESTIIYSFRANTAAGVINMELRVYQIPKEAKAGRACKRKVISLKTSPSRGTAIDRCLNLISTNLD
jgi:hypothetical protein